MARSDRRHPGDRPDDQRDVFARDRDRVLYTSALRRLGGVSQVVSAGEGHTFHNRLTHTLEVAQISRRLAEHLNREQEELGQKLGMSPEVAEAAALAHDLGHPPFGHVAEEALDRSMKAHGHPDGFEGNPQSFRVVTKLARRHERFPGLNLTRATLAAILKYPWYRQSDDTWRSSKWGAYGDDREDFEFARNELTGDWKSAEAEVVDWADDIAYAVHDVEDFFRAGLIPLDRLLGPGGDSEVESYCKKVFLRWDGEGITVSHDREALRESFSNVVDLLRHPELSRPYNGTLEQRAVLRSMTSTLIGLYIRGLTLREPSDDDSRRADRNPDHDRQLRMLKELTWIYVIRNPSLASQQAGQQRIVEELFKTFLDAARRNRALLPVSIKEHLDEFDANNGSDERELEYARAASDVVAHMAEDEAIRMFGRVSGTSLGSMFDRIG